MIGGPSDVHIGARVGPPRESLAETEKRGGMQRSQVAFFIVAGCVVFGTLFYTQLLEKVSTPPVWASDSDSALIERLLSHKIDDAIEKVVAKYKPPNQSTEQCTTENTAKPNLEDVANKRVLNLIFQMNPLPVDAGGQIMEYDWISHVLLGDIRRPVKIWTNHPGNYPNDSLTVVLFGPNPPLSKDNRGTNVGVYHMGDETYGGVDWYKDWDYVFRNYYAKNHETETLKKTNGKPPVLWVPLGMKTGYYVNALPSTLLPTSKRQLLCNFIGSRRSNRGAMIDIVKAKGIPCHIDADRPWGDPGGTKVVHYRQLLGNSKFTLAPWGNNAESLRFYEALEMGSIPITQRQADPGRDFFVSGLQAVDIIPSVADWAELPDLLNNLTADAVALDQIQRKVMYWWSDKKKQVQARIRQVIDNSFLEAYGTA
jgi:hypothetical protein